MRNSEQYIEVSIKLRDYSEELSEIVIAEVSSLPYEAFTEEPPLIKCYIQKDLYSQRDLKVVLSGIREVDSFEATLVQGENWNNEDLDLKTRSLITVVALMAQGITDSSLKYHIQNAKNHGVSQKEMAAAITHVAFYAGWPKAWATFNLAKEIYTEDNQK